MEFPRRMLHFHVVVVVRQGDADVCQLVPHLVEGGGLDLQLLVALPRRFGSGLGFVTIILVPASFARLASATIRSTSWPALRGRPVRCRYRSTAIPGRAP